MNWLFKVNYHPQLITIMTRTTVSASFSSNIIVPTLISILLYEKIDNLYLYIFMLISSLFFVTRISINKRLEKAVKNSQKTQNILYLLFGIVFLNTFLTGIVLWYSSLYADVQTLYALVFIVIALISGSIATINSVFHVYAIFVIFNLLPIIAIFIYHGGTTFYILALTISIYLLLMLKNGFLHYKIMKENIELKESFETRVNASIEEIREKDKILLQQSRLAQMGEMISMIAHQWRQPLSAISAISATIIVKAKMNKLEANQAEEMSEKILSSTKYLSETIDDFRNFFKSNKAKNLTSFNEILDSVLVLLEASLESTNIKLMQNLQENDMFYNYSNELKQVLLNILKNAQDALVDKRASNPYIKIESFTDTRFRYLKISDNAGGVQRKNLASIFDPYFSTKEKKDGTGLGLYMSKIIVEEHCNGHLEVQNNDVGAVFTITLPKEEI